jgi:hypothetical protein
MSQIIITAPLYNPSIGGAIVLHKLCHILNNLGYDASLYSTIKLNGQLDYFVLNENFNTKLATNIDSQNDIVIYPEIESFNPLGCNNVVRYILNTYHLPSKGSNVMSTWDEKDYWLYFHNLFYDNIKEPNFLHIIDTKLDLFKDYGLERKIDACFTFRKKTNEKNTLNIIHPQDAIEIPYNIPDKELANIFNICKRFYSYDTETYLNVLAAQCGCESVIVPYKDVTKESIINNQPSFKYGLAYGLDDLEYANSTRHLLREYLNNLENEQINNTKIAFEKIFKYFNL